MTTTSTDGRAMAGLAALLADTTRASFCLALLDGRAWTAGELARAAGVAPSTASDHLTRLVRGGLLVEERQGRHRYVRLANPAVAQLIEDLAGHAPAAPAPPRTLRAASAGAALAYARTCYDHLAGRLGVQLYDALLTRGLLDRTAGLALTPAGLTWLARLEVPVEPLRAARRPLVRDCLDWT
ncbi:ArsR/SmtB family transcription factor, partial [Micromonospora globispora]|uniref:ArsR/SmtB family transcription factor n=1 Tax=Micromonospora globispora TaxID=1450148 RepID=UPI000FC2EAA2